MIILEMIAELMVDNLVDHAERCGVDLHGVNKNNFNNELDTRFHDGGIARCEYFTDVCWRYCNQFGEFRDDTTGPWHEAHDEAVARALEILEERLSDENDEAC